MPNRERLKNLLLKLSYEKRDVTLASGRKSDFYIDVKQTSLHPEGAHLLGEALFDEIRTSFPDARAVGGPTLGADPLVSAVSMVSHLKKDPLPAFIIRKEPKAHGTGAWIEGGKNLAPAERVVLVEDVLTTGGSLLKAAEKVRYAGYQIEGLVVVVDREEGGRQAAEAKHFKLRSLFTKSQLLG